MDLNNEMVLMRKSIRRAKSFVATKLIRHIRNLKKKKGSENQMLKNNNRLKKLVEEMDILKELKPDKIFKFLLTSNMTLEDISKQLVVDLHERACVRVGLVPFIRQRMKTIREKVEEFDKNRSNKEEITSLKVVEKLNLSNRRDLKKKKIESKVIDAKRNTENCHKNVSESYSDEKNCEDVTISEDNDNTSSEITSLKNTSIAKTSKGDQINYHPESDGDPDEVTDDQLSSTSGGKSVNESICCSDSSSFDGRDSSDVNNGDIEVVLPDFYSKRNNLSAKEKKHLKSDSSSSDDERDSSGVNEGGIEVVLPDFYAKKKKSPSKSKQPKKRRVDLAVDSSTSDISHVLHNAGKGFADSDEEEAAIKRRRWANFQSDSEDDDFFITDKTTRLKDPLFPPKDQAMSSQLKKLMDMNPTNTKKVDDEDFERPRINKFFSQFSDLQERNTSKSRWSETRLTSRTAKHKKESVPKKLHLNPQATSQNTTNLKSEELKSVPTLHPSWQASKVKKQQNKIVQFTGKHVRFDDSD